MYIYNAITYNYYPNMPGHFLSTFVDTIIMLKCCKGIFKIPITNKPNMGVMISWLLSFVQFSSNNKAYPYL